MPNYNEYIGGIEAELNTDTGELHLIITDDEGDELLNTHCKMSKASKKEDSIVRFSIEEHPETGRKESFKGVLHPSGYSRWFLYIYPQFGQGTLFRGKLRIETTGANEYFQS